MENEIVAVLEYFAFFLYPPTANEIYTFLPKASKKAIFEGHLYELIREKKLLRYEFDQTWRYSLKKNSSFFKTYRKRYEESQKKVKKVQTYVYLLNFIPSILLVAYSGSIALLNANKRGDVDFFIVTKANQIWTGRFFALILAQILGLRDPKLSYRVCLNLFFDEQSLQVPDYKQNKYVAHEIVQIKLLINKKDTYENFITANKWMYKLYPNVKNKLKSFHIKKTLRLKNNLFMTFLEKVFKKIQLKILHRKLQEEKITKTRLWLIEKDFQEKLPEKLIS